MIYLLSNCCKAKIMPHLPGYGTAYQSCTKCNKPCDATPHQEVELTVRDADTRGTTGCIYCNYSTSGRCMQHVNERQLSVSTPHQEGEDSANFYQVGQMIECSNCHPEKYTDHQKTCNCKCHVPTTQSWEEKFDEKFGKDGPEKNCDSIGRGAGCDDCSLNIEERAEHKQFVAETLATAEAEWRERLESRVRKMIQTNWKDLDTQQKVDENYIHNQAISKVLDLINSTK